MLQRRLRASVSRRNSQRAATGSPPRHAAPGQFAALALLLDLWIAAGCGAKSELWVDEPPADAATDETVGETDGRDDGAGRDGDDGAAEDAPLDDAAPHDGQEAVERTIPVARSDDDALQDPDGSVLVEYPWMSLYSPEHRGGLRFLLEDVPRHATLLEATLEVYIDSPAEGAPADSIHREIGRDPPFFGTRPNDLGRRPLSAESVRWYDTGLPEGWAVSPSLVPLLQPLLDEADFAPGDAVVLIFVPGPEAGTGRAFEFRQFDHSAGGFAPRLRLRYLPP